MPDGAREDFGNSIALGELGEATLGNDAAWYLVVDLERLGYTVDARQSTALFSPHSAGQATRCFPLIKRRDSPFDFIALGRHEHNDICVPHPTVSRFHCYFRMTSEGLLLQDAGSSMGTTLNGVAVAPRRQGPPARVEDGHSLVTGSVRGVLVSAGLLQELVAAVSH